MNLCCSGNGTAVLLLLLSIFIGVLNDVCVKFLYHIPTFEISCTRYFFATIVLIPFMLCNVKHFKTHYVKFHAMRSIVFCIAISLWQEGLKTTTMSTTTLIGFGGAFSLLVLSYVLLGEHVPVRNFVVSLITFLSIFFVVDLKTISLTSGCFLIMISTFFFSFSDIVNKIATRNDESFITVLFYFNLFSCVVCVAPMCVNFVIPTALEIMYMVAIGIGANILLYTTLLAFSMADAAFLSQFKYSEFIFSSIIGYVICGEMPHKYSWATLLTIIICDVYLYARNKPRI